MLRLARAGRRLVKGLIAMEIQQDAPGLETANATIAVPSAAPADIALAERESPESLQHAGWKRGIRGLGRVLLLILAGVFFLLALLGALLPALPATPFLLLTSYFLIRSSPRLNAALLRSRLLGPILRDWQVRGGVRRDIKAKAVLVVVLSVAATATVLGYSLLPTLGLLALSAIGIAVIVRLPSPR